MMSDQVTWLAALFCLIVVAALLLWLPLVRSGALVEVNYNEGWNFYRQRIAGGGTPLYGAPPDFVNTNYPPFSFHFIGWLGKLAGVNLSCNDSTTCRKRRRLSRRAGMPAPR